MLRCYCGTRGRGQNTAASALEGPITLPAAVENPDARRSYNRHHPYMPNRPTPSDTFVRVEKLMRRDLKLGADIEINEETPFFGSSADIDSLDILLLLGSIEKEFGLKIP